MMRKMALKRLTASDLTFFEWHYRNQNAGNQKAINLNADVFIKELHPALPEVARDYDGKLPLDLSLFGPGLHGEHNLQRKIVKQSTYKNWRLNGEFIYNPEDCPDRFNVLSPGDMLVLEFSGIVSPSSARAVLVAHTQKEDQSLHAALSEFLGEKRMMRLNVPDLIGILDTIELSDEHPIHEFVLESSLEDAAHGGYDGTRRLLARRSGRRISRSELRTARESASRIGQTGEELICAYLTQLKEGDQIVDMEWTARENAISPYDFKIELPSKEQVVLDVKATSGDFDRPIHISSAELVEIAMGDLRYDLYRVYEIEDDSSAKLRVATNLRPFAQNIVNILEQLPDAVKSDGISVIPSSLQFSQEVLHVEIDSDVN